MKLVIAVLVLLLAGTIFLQKKAPSKIHEVEPVIEEITAYHKANGFYPSGISDWKSLTDLKGKFTVYPGKQVSDSVVEWSPHRVSEHDFTILTYKSGFSIFVPVTKIKPYSVSSFRVWQYDSAESRWQRGKIYWTWSGSFRAPISYWE